MPVVPKGAVVMDMAEKFHGFFAGAAVHNGASDPMVDEYYDDNLEVEGTQAALLIAEQI